MGSAEYGKKISGSDEDSDDAVEDKEAASELACTLPKEAMKSQKARLVLEVEAQAKLPK